MGRPCRYSSRNGHATANLDDYRYAGAGGHPLGEAHRGWPLVEIYRFAGPNGFIMKQLLNALLGAEAIAAEPEHAETIKASFREADRKGMLHAMRSMMLHRTGVEHLLPDIKVPTLVMAVRGDVICWRPDEARRTCAAIPDCRVEEVAGTGHISPLLIDRDRIFALLNDFWTTTRRETEFRQEKCE